MQLPKDVRAAVDANRSQLMIELEAARVELQRSRSAVSKLEREVAALEALLVDDQQPTVMSPPNGDAPLTLHDAMALVIREQPTRLMRPSDLAAEIRRRGLYVMRDGRPVEAQQIHARVGHYPQVLRKQGQYIGLAEDEG